MGAAAVNPQLSPVTVELLPCPFCGGSARRYEANIDTGGSAIECTGCKASTALHFDRKENLVSSWNDRKPQVRVVSDDDWQRALDCAMDCMRPEYTKAAPEPERNGQRDAARIRHPIATRDREAWNMTAPDTSVLLALAESCERAAGPDQELDAEIWMTLHPDWRDYPRNELGGWDCPTGRTRAAEPVTASIDAAMTLVPEGALWRVNHYVNIGTGELFARPCGEPRTVFSAGVGVGDVPATWTSGRHFTTPALALCAAALRARSSLTVQGE